VNRRPNSSLFLVGSLVLITACTSYQQVHLREVSRYNEVRVKLTDGRQAAIQRPWTSPDSIGGEGTDPIPLSQVVSAEAKGTNAGASVLLALGIVAGLGVAIGVALMDETLGP
jgi:hypothetical protein